MPTTLDMTHQNPDAELSKSLVRRLHLPAYSTKEAARLCAIPAGTISRWFHGYRPVFGFDPKDKGARLSYLHLIETSVVASFRQAGVSLQKIRVAHEYLRNQFKTEHPFAQLELKTDGAHIIKDLEDEEITRQSLILKDQYGQEAWGDLMNDRLEQFEYTSNLVTRWYPTGKQSKVVLDPQVSFGAPIVEGKGIATWAIMERVEIGEPLEEIADDFGLHLEDVEAAMGFEQQQLAA